MRRTLVLLLLLAGIVAVALLLLADHGAPGGGGGTEAGAGLQDPARGDPLPGAGAGADDPERQPGIQRSGTDPTAAAPLPADSNLLEIEVLRRDDRAPVAGAEVLIVDIGEGNGMPLMEEFFLGASVDGILDKFGVRHLTGPDGRVRVPVPGEGALLAGRKEQLFGVHPWHGEPDSGPGRRVTIEVEATAPLRIRVTDENGRPAAGVMVALRVGAGDFFSFDLLRARTGADGIGSIARAAAFATIFAPSEGASHSAAIAAVLPEPVVQELDLAHLPAEPVELRLPPTGSAIVKIRTPDGGIFRDPLLVALSKARENPEDDDDWLAPGMPGFDAASQRMLDGETRFEHVGLGLLIQASAVFPGAPQASIVRAQGPQRAGETVVLELVEQRNYPILLAQIMDPEGRPLAAQLVQVQLLMAGEERDWRNQHAARTDAEGRIRQGLMPVSGEETAVAIEWRRDAEAGRPELQARTELARPLKVGENDVGVIKLAPAAILASGRVLDPDGRPVAHASVTPAQREMNPFDSDHPDLRSDYERRRETDAQGVFTLTGAWLHPELILVVEAEGFLSVERAIAPGAQDVEIRLATSSALQARILADPGVDLTELRIDLVYSDAALEDAVDLYDLDGRIGFRSAQPGYADLVIRMPDDEESDEELLRITGILVGGAAVDPRLDPIDLRGKLYGCKIVARGEGGGELEDLQAWMADGTGKTVSGWNGSVSLISRQPLGEVIVSAPGWRQARLTPTKPTEEVILATGLQVRLSTQALAGPYRLAVDLISSDESGSWPSGISRVFDAAGNLSLTVSAPGSYEVAFLLTPPLAEGEEFRPWDHVWVPEVEGVARQRIEVIESTVPQIFRITAPSAERIAEAARQLEQEAEVDY